MRCCLRKNIVCLLEQKKSNSEIAEILGVSEKHVRSVKKSYSEKGIEGLKPRKRGQEKGKNLILTEEKEKEIQKLLIDTTPDQRGSEECMWTRKVIQNLIEKKYRWKGKTPVVKKEAKKLKINMLSTVTKRGKLRFMLYKYNMNTGKLIDFMRRLIRESKKKVFLMLDNLKV